MAELRNTQPTYMYLMLKKGNQTKCFSGFNFTKPVKIMEIKCNYEDYMIPIEKLFYLISMDPL